MLQQNFWKSGCGVWSTGNTVTKKHNNTFRMVSNVQCRMSDVEWCRMSDDGCRMSNVGRRMSDVGGWMQYSICGKTRGSAMYFWLILTIFRGINTNLEVEKHHVGVKPPNTPDKSSTGWMSSCRMSVFVDEQGLTVDADVDRHWRWSDVGNDRDALHVTVVIVCREDQLICRLLRPVDHLSQAEFTDERGRLERDESARDVDIVHIDVHVWGRVSPDADATETPGMLWTNVTSAGCDVRSELLSVTKCIDCTGAEKLHKMHSKWENCVNGLQIAVTGFYAGI